MRWRRNWSEGAPRPTVRRLGADEQQRLLAQMTEEIARSPVLSAFGIQVRFPRGRFYVERPRPKGAGWWGRITPIQDDLLLEVERRSWKEVARGTAQKLIKAIAGDTRGTFHGLGYLDQSLRKAGQGLTRQSVEWEANRFVYADTGAACSVQEVLFHFFGLPVEVAAEPANRTASLRSRRIPAGLRRHRGADRCLLPGAPDPILFPHKGQNMTNTERTHLGRRAFLQRGSLVLAAVGLDLGPADSLLAGEGSAKGGVKFGLITDLHYADKPPAGSRHYRESLSKLAEAARQFEKDRPAFVVELGDLVDAAASVATEQAYLKRINGEFSALARDRHYVLGNHCVDTLTKPEFLDGVGQKQAHYSFDRGGVHFVVLDACFRGDGKPYGRKNSRWNDANIPAEQIEWLKGDLKATDRKVIVFAHQRLDVANDYGVKNARAVRTVLEDSGKVLAVFQGHSHKNDYKEVAGIHYCTLVAMVEGAGAENNGYSTAEVRADGTVILTGFRKQKGYRWGSPTAPRRSARPSSDREAAG